MYRSVYADIEGLTFRGLDSLNSAIRGSLEKFNAARMASREYSRRELFERTEADYLRPLPTVRYQMKKRRTATVMRNSYITSLQASLQCAERVYRQTCGYCT